MTKTKPKIKTRRTANDLTFATTNDTRDFQYRADVVIDLRSGTILKNRFGLTKYARTHLSSEVPR